MQNRTNLRDELLTEVFGLPRDPRVQHWILIKYPSITIAIIALYLCFVKIWGPKWMKDKKAYSLKNIILCYNAAMVVMNVVFLQTTLGYSYFGGGYSIICQPIDYSDHPNTLYFLKVLSYMAMVRIMDLLDTIFFVLRKKFNQVSTLHVVHHSLIVFDCWLFMWSGATGHNMFIVCLNTFIHIIMYSYYFLSCLGPTVRKYLWWKRYLTLLQILQFVVALIHAVFPLFLQCGYPSSLVLFAMVQGFLFLYLFTMYYREAYAAVTKKHTS